MLEEANRLGAEQLLLVFTSGAGESRAELNCLEKTDGKWRATLPVIAASVGRNGIADPGEKREGDGCSPYGLHAVGMAFGYPATCTTKMPYRQMTADDIWVDDPAAPDYNRLTQKAATSAKSFEYMRRKDKLYKYGLVVEYNTNPVVAGLGSAIFIHIWSRPYGPTAGCLALSEENMLKVLALLDPAKSPIIGFFRKVP
jgi:L,D-peptidoglycan transpeptidase YkuD (ErfK/YbiS/YcfS/YnhG family)